MPDFSTVKIHCSQISRIMASASNEKTPKELYQDAIALLAIEEDKLAAMPAHHLGKRKQKEAKIERVLAEIAQLEPNKEDDALSYGAKKFIKELYGYVMYGKWGTSKDIGNKFTVKGKEVEAESIEMINRIENSSFEKNLLYFENDFICGTPDIVEGEDPWNAKRVRDVKNSWDTASFFNNLDEELNPQYYWQIQGYLALTNAPLGEVDYCLVSIPEGMIFEEKMKLARRLGAIDIDIPEFAEDIAEMDNNLRFEDIPEYHRMLPFPVQRNEEDIKRIYGKVKLCRDYLKVVHEAHINMVNRMFEKEQLPEND